MIFPRIYNEAGYWDSHSVKISYSIKCTVRRSLSESAIGHLMHARAAESVRIETQDVCYETTENVVA